MLRQKSTTPGEAADLFQEDGEVKELSAAQEWLDVLERELPGWNTCQMRKWN